MTTAGDLAARAADPVDGLFDLAELTVPTSGPAWPVEQVEPARPITVAGRRLVPSVVFDTYWRFAAARQDLYIARQRSPQGPWTCDPVLAVHRFTNCYRAADRVSQFLIKDVIYGGNQQPDEVVFRVLLFKLFNRITTWEMLQSDLGELTWAEFDIARYERVLDQAFTAGQRLYSAAYVVPPPQLGRQRKHANHLELVMLMMNSGAARRIVDAEGLHEVFDILKSFPAIGDFLGYQFAIDINYSEVTGYDEDEFVVAGPGARDGIRKCFGPAADGIEQDVIRYMADHQQEHFHRLGLSFAGLRGRPLKLIDCQNLFCEVDKYARVVHPHVIGHSGRQRIKQRYRPVLGCVSAGWFPPKWGINVTDDARESGIAREPRLAAPRPQAVASVTAASAATPSATATSRMVTAPVPQAGSPWATPSSVTTRGER